MAARAKRTKRVSVTIPDEQPFDVWYRAAVLTPRFMREMDEVQGNVEKTVAMTVRLVDQWDVWETLDENGNGIGDRLPVTDETVSACSFSVLNAIITAVMADISPDPTPAVDTGSFSLATANGAA